MWPRSEMKMLVASRGNLGQVVSAGAPPLGLQSSGPPSVLSLISWGSPRPLSL